MIDTQKHVTYVGPFDRICRGLRLAPATTDSEEALGSLTDGKKP